MSINIILAVDQNNGLGKDGVLPWKISDELKIFKEKTLDSILIVGRKTLEKLPKLKDRTIFCITKSINLKTNNEVVHAFSDINVALQQAMICSKNLNKKIFIIGGNQIYNYFFKNYKKDLIVHISFINSSYPCDTFFNIENLKDFYISKKNEYEQFLHCEMIYQRYGEYQYLNLIKDLINNGERRKTRNAETLSDFCNHLKFDLRDGFPLLTTKKMFLKGIIEELLFFIRGDTDSKILEEKGITIWKGNTSREFLDKVDLSYYEDGIMGPMYGYQWRFFNAPYDLKKFAPNYDDIRYNSKAQYPEYGVDQISNIIDEIINNPTSRRILMTSFNPAQVSNGVLWPCHSITLQFYVQDGYLDMFCYCRSQDTALGTGFNIASSSLLLMIIAQITNLIPRYMNMTMGDTHIYSEHVDPIKTQLERIPYTFPTLILPKFKTLEEVEKLTFNDFKLENYRYYPTIKMPMIA
jgi:dihydrofolate reductase/thymidylate synthase